MALKRRSKVSGEFSMASMTDIVFLLLLFFMISSTLVAPNALKLLLPKSNNQTAAKPLTTISIKKDLTYYVNDNGKVKQVAFQEIEPFLQSKFGKNNPDIYISLHMEKTLPVEEMVKIMNIAVRNQYKMILATAPE